MFPKPNYKKNNRKSTHDFSQEIKQKEYAEAKGLCRICQYEPITQYHHINEKGMGGGKGLGIQINCLGVGDICHNHDDSKFLVECNKILEQRVDEIFNDYQFYTFYGISERLNIIYEIVVHQAWKGFLHTQRDSRTGDRFCTTEDIKRWLGCYSKQNGGAA